MHAAAAESNASVYIGPGAVLNRVVWCCNRSCTKGCKPLHCGGVHLSILTKHILQTFNNTYKQLQNSLFLIDVLSCCSTVRA